MPIGAIYAAQQPVPSPDVIAAIRASEDERRKSEQRRRADAVEARKRADEIRFAGWQRLIDSVLALADPVDRLLMAIALFTEEREPGGWISATEGDYLTGGCLTKALPDLFPRTVHDFDPHNVDHAPWDSEQVARAFASRMATAGRRPPDVHELGRSWFARRRPTARPTTSACWRIDGGSTDVTVPAYVYADGAVELGHVDSQGRKPRLNVVALRRMAELLDLGPAGS